MLARLVSSLHHPETGHATRRRSAKRSAMVEATVSEGRGVRLTLIVLWSVCLAQGTAASLWAQQDSGVIEGRVTDSSGQPQRLLVHLLAAGDIPAGDAFTDSNGQYTFFALPNGDYWVVVEAESFRPARQHVMLDMRIHP